VPNKFIKLTQRKDSSFSKPLVDINPMRVEEQLQHHDGPQDMINRVAGPVGGPNLAEHIEGRLTQRLSGRERDQHWQSLAGTQDNRLDRIGILSHLFTI
jgi:hypothetical protein